MKMHTLVLLLSVAVVLAGCTSQPDQTTQGPRMTGLSAAGSYETDPPDDLPLAKPTAIVNLENGGSYVLTVEKVRKEIAGRSITMYGYNGMIPGPLFRVDKNTRASITVVNKLDKETSVHWHGLRGDYRFDGVIGLGQDSIKPGDSFTYELVFPDEGVYWYHPHFREDAQQDLGLAGNIFVNDIEDVAGKPDQEEFLILDDILLDSKGIVPFGENEATHAIMGRYGNILMINGENDFELSVKTNNVIRLYFTNVANVRPFNISIPGARMKLVAGDSGAYLNQEFVQSIIVAPAERYVVDVLFEEPGTYEIRADNPIETHSIGKIIVKEGQVSNAAKTFDTLKINSELESHLERLAPEMQREIDRTLELDFELPGTPMHGGMMGMMEEDEGGIEWEDTMPMMAGFTSKDVKWIIRDTKSGKENSQLTIQAKIGDIEKWRIVNKGDSAHPMQHPIHLHGQRFLILSQNGVPVVNPVWKDVILVPIGQTAEILVEYTNAGEWMLHCHIAEHLETGMFAYVSVADSNGERSPRIGEMKH